MTLCALSLREARQRDEAISGFIWDRRIMRASPGPSVQDRARFVLLALTAVLPAGCAGLEPPANPFVGAWATAERQQIAFRDTTIVVSPPDGAPTPMGADSCSGAFRFSYGRQSREALLGLTPQQPDLKKKLATLLVQPDYPVAELACGTGGSTYVLLGAREIVAIYRDRDIAGVERLSRL
jgi:hypothetical protein